MKFKTFTLTLLLAAAGLSAQTAKFGMQTEIGGGIALSSRNYSSLQLHLSPGFRLDPSWFVGMGVGVNYHHSETKWDNTNYTATTIDGTVYQNKSDNYYFLAVPVYAHATYTLPTQGAWAPFANVKLGYGIVDRISNTETEFGNRKYAMAGGLYVSPAIGVKYRLNNKHALSLSVSYDYQGIKSSGRTIREYYGSDEFITICSQAEALSLRLGWEF